jgi:hypothetical protein
MSEEKPLLKMLIALLIIVLAVVLKENARKKLPGPINDNSFAI